MIDDKRVGAIGTREEEEDQDDTPVPPQSEPPKNEVEDKPVTQVQLKAILENMGKEMTQIVNSIKEAFENVVSQKINANTVEISRVLQEHAVAINNLAGQRSEQPQQQGASKVEDIFQKLTTILDNPFVQKKLGIQVEPVDTELSNLSQLVTLGVKREMVNAYKNSVKKFVRKDLLFQDEVAGAIDIAAEKAVEHGI